MFFGWTPSAVSVASSFVRPWMVLTIALLIGCGGDLVLPEGEGSIAIRVVNGDGQTGEVGHLLSEPVVVEVTDQNSSPVHDAAVVFQLTSAGEGADIIPDTVITDSDGRAEAHLVLGDKVGEQIGVARVVVDSGTAPTVPFSATATSGNPGAENRPPHADFHSHCEDLGCQFTDASTDSDGSVTAWSWQFGDGGSSDQADPGHLYPGPGTYSVTLTITDNEGATDQTTAHIEVSASPPQANEPPHADFDVHCHELDCSFTDRSQDHDGSVTSWLWQFGDGSISTEQNPLHSYSHEGHYDVTLMVTDNQGATDSRSHDARTKD